MNRYKVTISFFDRLKKKEIELFGTFMAHYEDEAKQHAIEFYRSEINTDDIKIKAVELQTATNRSGMNHDIILRAINRLGIKKVREIVYGNEAGLTEVEALRLFTISRSDLVKESILKKLIKNESEKCLNCNPTGQIFAVKSDCWTCGGFGFFK